MCTWDEPSPTHERLVTWIIPEVDKLRVDRRPAGRELLVCQRICEQPHSLVYVPGDRLPAGATIFVGSLQELTPCRQLFLGLVHDQARCSGFGNRDEASQSPNL